MVALQGQLKRVKVDLCEALYRILRGELTLVGRDAKERGLNRLLVSAEDLAGLVAAREREFSQGGLSVAEATHRLGFADPNIVTTLVKARLLSPNRSVRKRTEKVLFHPREIERFNRTLISLREVAHRRLFGRFSGPAVVTAWLARRGIKPVCGPDLNSVPAIFFDRDEVEGLSWFSSSQAGG